jgi:hypothetical protein
MAARPARRFFGAGLDCGNAVPLREIFLTSLRRPITRREQTKTCRQAISAK